MKKRCRYRHCCPPLTIRQYSSVRRRAYKQHRFLTKSLTHSEKIFSFMKSRNAGIPAYFKWRGNINGQIFRYGKHCTLIVLSYTLCENQHLPILFLKHNYKLTIRFCYCNSTIPKNFPDIILAFPPYTHDLHN